MLSARDFLVPTGARIWVDLAHRKRIEGNPKTVNKLLDNAWTDIYRKTAKIWVQDEFVAPAQ